MYVIATFEHSVFLELALSDLELRGIERADILAAPLHKKQRQMQVFDTIHRADGVSVLDSAFITAALTTTIGAVYGYVLPGGPLLWGLIGLFGGGTVALGIDYFLTKRDRGQKGPPLSSEVVIIIKCDASQIAMVEDTLLDHLALGVARVA
ncbi:MAG: hypothetical protein P4N59_17710 [Negativicutes bacterium]|nr:hypothetical protein [Negativicutes bacterium]